MIQQCGYFAWSPDVNNYYDYSKQGPFAMTVEFSFLTCVLTNEQFATPSYQCLSDWLVFCNTIPQGLVGTNSLPSMISVHCLCTLKSFLQKFGRSYFFDPRAVHKLHHPCKICAKQCVLIKMRNTVSGIK